MIVLGLTGSIGMGKSTLANMMRERGIPVHESDIAVHDLLGPGGAAVPAVASAFPESYDRNNNSVMRPILGAIIFADDNKRILLEAILHPLVQKSQEDFLQNCRYEKQKIACLDIPLLFETQAEQRVDKIIVVTAPAEVQRARVLARPHMDENRLKAILARQMPDAQKRQRSDFIIDTGTSPEQTQAALDQILDTLSKTSKEA